MRMFYTAPLVLLMCCWACCLGSEWRGKQAEIYFAVDASGSMFTRDFQLQLNLVADLVSDMDIGPDQTRVGLGLYSTSFQNYIPLDNKYNKADLISAISRAPHSRGYTYISKALQGIRRQLDKSVTRSDVPRICVFFTDGSSLYQTLTYDNASLAKQNDIFIFVIGIGSLVNKRELRDISSDPKRDFLYYVDTFRQLETLRSQLSANMAKVRLYQNDKGTCGERKKVDTVFVFDEVALGAAQVDSVKRFLTSIADDLRMNPGNIRLGVVSKSQPIGRDIQLGDYVTREEFKDAIAQYTSGPGLYTLIREARETHFDTKKGHRTDAIKRLVVIMGNPVKPEHENRFYEQMMRAKFYNNIEVFIIRLGSDYNKANLSRLASSSSHVLYVDMDQAKEPFLQLFCKDI